VAVVEEDAGYGITTGCSEPGGSSNSNSRSSTVTQLPQWFGAEGEGQVALGAVGQPVEGQLAVTAPQRVVSDTAAATAAGGAEVGGTAPVDSSLPVRAFSGAPELPALGSADPRDAHPTASHHHHHALSAPDSAGGSHDASGGGGVAGGVAGGVVIAGSGSAVRHSGVPQVDDLAEVVGDLRDTVSGGVGHGHGHGLDGHPLLDVTRSGIGLLAPGGGIVPTQHVGCLTHCNGVWSPWIPPLVGRKCKRSTLNIVA
jgi:hypothetical protein